MKGKRRQFVLLTLIGAIPLLLAAEICLLFARNSLESSVANRLQAESDRVAAEIDEHIKRVGDYTQLIARQTDLQYYLSRYKQELQSEVRAGIQRSLFDSAEALSDLSLVAVFSEGGRFIASSQEPDANQERALSEVVQQGQETLSHTAFVVGADLRLHMAVKRAIVQSDRTIGFLVVVARAQTIDQLLRRPFGIGVSEEAVLLRSTSEGVTEFLSKPPGSTGFEYKKFAKRVPTSSAMDLALSGRQGAESDILDYRGTAVIAAFRYLEPVNWALVLKIERGEVYAPVKSARAFIACVLFAVVLISFLISRFAPSAPESALTQLKLCMERLARGELGIRLAVDPSSEFRNLFNSFNDLSLHMQQLLEQKRRQLDELREKEKELLSVVDSSVDAVVITDPFGVVVRWNPAAERIFGQSENSAIGKNFVQLVELPDKDETGCWELTSVLRNDNNEYTNQIIKTLATAADGSRFPLEIYVCAQIHGSKTFSIYFMRDLRSEEEAFRTKETLAAIIETSNDAIISTDLNGYIQSWNSSASRLFGYDVKEVAGKSIGILLNEENKQEVKDVAHTVRNGQGVDDLELVLRNNLGECFTASISLSPVKNAAGHIAGVSIIARNISEKKVYEEQIIKSLKEKEMLLKEVHHRVKNNMQIIGSLLRRQRSFIDDADCKLVFEQCEQRIRSMSLIHEKLYRTDSFNCINFGEYARRLAKEIHRANFSSHERVRFEFEAADVSIDVDRCITCGLLLNELITNAYKHAFAEQDEGLIRITLEYVGDGEVILSVFDNGKGLPEDFTLNNPLTLGTELIATLSKQLDAELHFATEEGTTVSVAFSITNTSNQRIEYDGTNEHTYL